MAEQHTVTMTAKEYKQYQEKQQKQTKKKASMDVLRAIKKRSSLHQAKLKEKKLPSIHDSLVKNVCKADKDGIILGDRDLLYSGDYIEIMGILDCDANNEKVIDDSYDEHNFEYDKTVLSAIPSSLELQTALENLNAMITALHTEKKRIIDHINTDIRGLVWKTANEYMNKESQ